MNDYGMNNGERNTSGRAEGQDNPAHSRNFSLQRYVADAERNVNLRRPILRLPEDQNPQRNQIPADVPVRTPSERAQTETRTQKNEKNSPQKNDREAVFPIKRPQKDEYIPEPFLGYYPLAGRTTYIGSHKKKANRKLFLIIAAAIVIVLAFVFLNFRDKIFPSSENSESARANRYTAAQTYFEI